MTDHHCSCRRNEIQFHCFNTQPQSLLQTSEPYHFTVVTKHSGEKEEEKINHSHWELLSWRQRTLFGGLNFPHSPWSNSMMVYITSSSMLMEALQVLFTQTHTRAERVESLRASFSVSWGDCVCSPSCSPLAALIQSQNFPLTILLHQSCSWNHFAPKPIREIHGTCAKTLYK